MSGHLFVDESKERDYLRGLVENGASHGDTMLVIEQDPHTLPGGEDLAER